MSPAHIAKLEKQVVALAQRLDAVEKRLEEF